MTAHDAMEFINQQDEATLQRFVERLEFRGRDPTFVAYRDAYVAKMALARPRTCSTLVAAPASLREPWQGAKDSRDA